MKSGYLYVLVHPSDSNLYKIGVTTCHPEKRLSEHNKNYKECVGQIVKETGQKWEVKTYIDVPDPYWAENVFWGATGLADIPYRNGIEIMSMDWKTVQTGLNAAKKAGVRPPPPGSSLPNHIYANTAWMKKRLEGRDITLVGHVRSKTSGRNTFQCSNGHEWRTIPNNVAEGEGCPHCGVGKRSPEEIRNIVKVGVICLLIHPNKPGIIRIGLVINKKPYEEVKFWDNWEIHRYQNVEEPALAESLIWELLGHPKPDNCDEPINIDLASAEEAFRHLHYRLQNEIALTEKAKNL
jgi:hypothetical protein